MNERSAGAGTAAVLEAVAADSIPADADLWPRVAARAVAERRRRRARLTTRALMAVGGVALVLLVVATAGATVNQLGRQAAGLLLVPTWPPPAPTARPGSAPGPAKPVASEGRPAIRTGGQTLAEVQAQVSFPICAPTWLPPGVALIGGTAFPPDGAIVVFRPTDGRETAGGGIQQTRRTGDGGYVVPAQYAHEVRVAGHDAYLARGAFDKESNWHPEYDSAILSWEADGITYVAQYGGLGLSEQEVLRIAESCAPVAPR